MKDYINKGVSCDIFANIKPQDNYKNFGSIVDYIISLKDNTSLLNENQKKVLDYLNQELKERFTFKEKSIELKLRNGKIIAIPKNQDFFLKDNYREGLFEQFGNEDLEYELLSKKDFEEIFEIFDGKIKEFLILIGIDVERMIEENYYNFVCYEYSCDNEYFANFDSGEIFVRTFGNTSFYRGLFKLKNNDYFDLQNYNEFGLLDGQRRNFVENLDKDLKNRLRKKIFFDREIIKFELKSGRLIFNFKEVCLGKNKHNYTFFDLKGEVDSKFGRLLTLDEAKELQELFLGYFDKLSELLNLNMHNYFFIDHYNDSNRVCIFDFKTGKITFINTNSITSYNALIVNNINN